MQRCVGAVLLRDGLILLGKRGRGARSHHDTWDVIGGHCEGGESDEQALVRELDEELGIAPTRYRSLGEHAEPPDAPVVSLHLFVVEAWRGTPANRSPEHDAIAWHDPTQLGSLRLASPRLLEILSPLDTNATRRGRPPRLRRRTP